VNLVLNLTFSRRTIIKTIVENNEKTQKNGVFGSSYFLTIK
jgi:hypothetical protein